MKTSKRHQVFNYKHFIYCIHFLSIDFESRCPPFQEEDEQSVKTEYVDFDPAKHSPVFYGKMHQRIEADADPLKEIDPATSHPACAGFAFTDKPPASPPPPPPEPPHKDKCRSQKVVLSLAV